MEPRCLTPNSSKTDTVKLDLHIGLWGAAPTDRHVELAQRSKALGFAMVLGGYTSREVNFNRDMAARVGFGDAVAMLHDLYLNDRQQQAVEAVPLELTEYVAWLLDLSLDRRESYDVSTAHPQEMQRFGEYVENRNRQLRNNPRAWR